MTTNDDVIRLRTYPAAKPKAVPAAREHWPDGSVVYHSLLNPDGSLRIGCALESIGEWTFAECLVVPERIAPKEINDYCRNNRANVLPGCHDELKVLALELTKVNGKTGGLGYELRRRGYRSGWAIVGADLPRQLIAIADHWTEARTSPGNWSIVLVGLGEWLGEHGSRRHRKFPDAPRINLKVLGDHVLISWGSTRRGDHLGEDGTRRRPANRLGPFVDVLSAGSALAGGPVRDLAHACRLFGVEIPDYSTDPIDRLRAETLSIAKIYRRQVVMIEELGLGIDLSNLVSTGGIATALLREMVAGS